MIDSVKALIINVFDKLKSENIVVTDLYLTFDLDRLSVTIFDDNSTELSSATIKTTKNTEYNNNSFLELIKNELSTTEAKDAFAALDYSYPVSVLLTTDDDYCELATYDSNNIYIHDDVLDGMFKELDDFIEKTLSDI